MKFSVGDKVIICEPYDDNHGTIGTIIRYENDDDSYLVEFEFQSVFGSSKHTAWYYGSSDFVATNSPSYTPKAVGTSYCAHNWKEDKWFTSKIYKTCIKCGKKYEDL